MNLKNMLSERSQSQGTTFWIHLYEMSRKGNWWRRKADEGFPGAENKRDDTGDKNVINWFMVMATPLGKVTENHWIVHLYGGRFYDT